MFFDYSFLIITLLSLTEIYGDFSLQFYAQTNKVEWLAHGVLGYAGVVFFLIQALRSNNVLYVNGLWDGVSGVLESIAAYYILGDRLEKSAQYIGLLFVMAGILLMKMDGK
jgi:multidrug transporter EmrE-like cation transporter